MILASHGIIASQIASFDADAAAFFARVTAAGGTLSATEKIATNQLVLDMKSAGIWSSMKAIYPMVGASAAACSRNLKADEFNGTFTSNWTFASTGVTPNGTSDYMDTGLNPFSVFSSANSMSLSYYSRTSGQASATKYQMGSYDGTSECGLIIRWIDGNAFSIINETRYNCVYINNDTHGFYFANRNATNIEQAWKNGIKEKEISNTPTTITNKIIYLGATYLNTVASLFDNKQCGFSSIGDGLTDTQASNFYTSVQAFQRTLGRQV
jgi:hypothetical protein